MITIERVSDSTHSRSYVNNVSELDPKLHDPMQPPETLSASTVPDNDADIASIHANPLRGKLADIQGNLRRNNALSSAFQNYREILAYLMKKREQIREEVRELARLKRRRRDKKAQEEAIQKKIVTFKKQINELSNKADLNGNKIFTAAGQDMAIFIGNDVVINIPAKNFGVSLTDTDLSEEPNTLFKKIKEQIQAILEYDGFLIGVEEKLESAATLMAFELHDILEVEQHMAKTNMTLEVAKYTLARVMENMRRALQGQAHVSPAEATVLLVNTN